MELTAETYTMLSDVEGYFLICTKEGRGICALRKFAFTIGLCYGIDKLGYVGRYCYPKELALEAVRAFINWDGTGDPEGPWLKHKGEGIDIRNPKLDEGKAINKSQE